MNALNDTRSTVLAQLSRTSVPGYLKQLWETLLRVPDVKATDNFFQLGGDSLSIIEMLVCVQAHFDREFDFTPFFPEPTIRTLGPLIAEQLK